MATPFAILIFKECLMAKNKEKIMNLDGEERKSVGAVKVLTLQDNMKYPIKAV